MATEPLPGVTDATPRPLGSPGLWLILTVLAVGLTVAVWTAPVTTTNAEMRPYRITYTFDHATPLPDNVVYEQGQLRLGDPIFLAVVDRLDVVVDYELGADDDGIQLADGELQAHVEVVSTAGWARTLARSQPMVITDRRAQVSVPVDFAAARAIADDIDAAIGASGSLSVRVRADATVDGTLERSSTGPVRLDEHTGAEVVFSLGSQAAELVVPRSNQPEPGLEGLAPGTAGASTRSADQASGDTADAPGADHPGRRELVRMVPTDVPGPNRFTVLGRSLEVPTLRIASIVLVVLFAGLSTYGLLAQARARRQGAVASIAATFHNELVPAARLPAVPSDRVIDLARFDDLLAISRNLELPLVVWHHDDIVTYAVTDGLTRYRFETLVDAPRHATVTRRSVAAVAGRRASDDPDTTIVIDVPVAIDANEGVWVPKRWANELHEDAAPRRRASDRPAALETVATALRSDAAGASGADRRSANRPSADRRSADRPSTDRRAATPPGAEQGGAEHHGAVHREPGQREPDGGDAAPRSPGQRGSVAPDTSSPRMWVAKSNLGRREEDRS